MKSLPPFSRKWGGSVGKSILLARANLRKIKGAAISITVLILLAALLLNLWLMLAMDYKQNFDRCHDRLNAEHVLLAVDDDAGIRKLLAQTVEGNSGTEEFVLDECLHMTGQFCYNGGEINADLIFLEKEAAMSRAVGKIEIVEEGEIESGIYLPILCKSDDIAIGKTTTVSIGSGEMTYTICGFFNSAMAGSHNCVVCEMILTADQYEKLEEAGYAQKSALCSVRLYDKDESQSYEAMLKSAVSAEYPDAYMGSTTYTLVVQSRYISQMICAGVISAMAFCILLIALIVIVSNIINFIQENMKNLGALGAIGYLSRQLIGSLMTQFLGLSLISATAGIALSYVLFPFVNTMMISQTGIPYAVHFLPLPFLLTLTVAGGFVALVVWLSARRIKKVEPIVRLRQGVQTHNFKRNHVPLDKTRAPLSFALALKTTCSGVKSNVTVCITMLVLSLIVVFSGLMYENMIADSTSFINLIVGETSDSCINVNAEIEDDFLREMNADDRVEAVYLYNSLTVSHAGGVELMATISDDFSKLTNQSIVFEGRFPKYDNELALAAKYAKEKDLKIGDEITISAGGKEAVYLISGFTQISNNLGKDCLMTRSGYERLETPGNLSYYLHLRDGADIDQFNEEISERYGNDINATINVQALVESTSEVYISLMTAIVIVILVLSVIVIAFVLYLLVRTMLNNKKREYGILKALGYTTGQLMMQTALSFLPAIAVSTAAGVAISSLMINPLMGFFLSSLGIVKCTFFVPVGLNAAAGAGLVALSFVMACLMSFRVRRVTPTELLAGE